MWRINDLKHMLDRQKPLNQRIIDESLKEILKKLLPLFENEYHRTVDSRANVTLDFLIKEGYLKRMAENTGDIFGLVDKVPEYHQLFMELERIIRTDIYSEEVYDSFYRRIYEAFNDKNIRDLIIYKIVKDYGIDNAQILISKVIGDLGEEFIWLLSEPAMVSHLDEFIDFAKQKGLNESNLSSLDLRAEFKTYKGLNPRTIYRSISLNKDQELSVKAEGFKSGILRGKFKNPVSAWINGMKETSFGHVANGNTGSSNLLSVSAYESMARFASRDFHNIENENGQDEVQRLVYEMSVNPYFLINFNEFLPNTLMSRYEMSISKNLNSSVTLRTHEWYDSETGQRIDADNPDVEMLMEWGIPNIQDEPKIVDEIPAFEFLLKSNS